MATDTPLAESPLAKALRTYSSGTAGDAIDTQAAKRLGLIGGGDLTTLGTATLAALEAYREAGKPEVTILSTQIIARPASAIAMRGDILRESLPRLLTSANAFAILIAR